MLISSELLNDIENLENNLGVRVTFNLRDGCKTLYIGNSPHNLAVCWTDQASFTLLYHALNRLYPILPNLDFLSYDVTHPKHGISIYERDCPTSDPDLLAAITRLLPILRRHISE